METTVKQPVLLQLLYFSADHDPKSGLFKAMSLLCGSEVDPNNTEVAKYSCLLHCIIIIVNY